MKDTKLLEKLIWKANELCENWNIQNELDCSEYYTRFHAFEFPEEIEHQKEYYVMFAYYLFWRDDEAIEYDSTEEICKILIDCFTSFEVNLKDLIEVLRNEYSSGV